jgi:hypothetical protein
MEYLARLKVAIESTSSQVDEVEKELLRLERRYSGLGLKGRNQESTFVRRIGAERERLERLRTSAQGRLSRLYRQLVAVQTGREESGVPEFDGGLGRARDLTRQHVERLRHR